MSQNPAKVGQKCQKSRALTENNVFCHVTKTQKWGKTWSVRITVAECWIEDGFNLSASNLKNAILSHLLRDAYEGEVDVEVKPINK